MEWKPRVIDLGELDIVIDLSSIVFGGGPVAPEAWRKQVGMVAELDRTFVVDDGPTIAGTGGHFSFEMTLPGGAAVPIGAVTEVGVLPTHRRRGVLTAIMGALMDQSVDRGEPVAGLTASEASIYRRYGFGVGTRYHTVVIDTTRTAELVELPAPGRVRMVSEGEAGELFPTAWEARWRHAAGELSRNPLWWQMLALDPEDDRNGASPRYLVVHEDADGRPDGFAAYRLKEVATPTGTWFELLVADFAAADDRVEAALLRFLMDVDLVRQVRWVGAPVDLSLRWRLADSRAVKVEREQDHLWLRVLDVARCLGSRTYAAEGGGVVEVVDARRPEVGGRFGLDVGPDGADCVRVSVEPDVVLATPELGSVLLGGVTWGTLHRAGMVEERTPGAVDRLDAVFRPSRAPHCVTDF